ncbi:MAG: sigma-54-dependent Fis family transcriptional regulator, partial [Gammaproteobacteria bacterium]|nr:sigma-54-dependent Fis family transcriptional regulator [Gammaproteobacteria bacterium]
VESMPAHLQVRLLRVLQERCLERVGGNTPISVDIRVIAASKVDLKLAVDAGRFREDLYYRLNVANIAIPSLVDRRADIPLLFRYFADLAAQRYRRPLPKIDDRFNSELMRQSWPGNVRELRNAAERFVLGLFQESPEKPPAGVESPLAEAMDAFECQTIEAALRANDGHIENTARALGVPRKTLYLRMKKYSLAREDFH